MEFGGGSLAWLQRNGALTRGKMATYIRRGQPGQWALDSALRETHLEWRSPAMQPLAELPESKPGKRPADVQPGTNDRKRQVKGDSFRTVSQVKGVRRSASPGMMAEAAATRLARPCIAVMFAWMKGARA